MTGTSGAPALAPLLRQGSGLRLPIGIIGTGMHVPATVVTNHQLTEHLDTSDEWIRSRTGIRERRFLEPGLQTSDMCVHAARQALERSEVTAAELDAIVLATFTYDQPLPSTALIVKELLGAERAWPIDLNQAACAGGVYGILLASHLLQSQHMRRVLVIGAECLSRVTDPADRGTRVFFGDAAGAVVLGRTRERYGLLSWDVGSSLSYAVEIPAGGSRAPASAATVAAGDHFLKMDGREVWDEATVRLPDSIARAVAAADLELAQIRHYFLHQANANIIAEAMRRLGVPLERASLNISWLGNTGAATVFTVLHQAMAERLVQRDDLLVIAGIGAGFLWGSLCLRHY